MIHVLVEKLEKMTHTLLAWSPAHDTFPAMIAALTVLLLLAVPRRQRTRQYPNLPDLRETPYARATIPKVT